MAVPAGRKVVFVTGNAKKLEEVGVGRFVISVLFSVINPEVWNTLQAAFATKARAVFYFYFFICISYFQVIQILGDKFPYKLVSKKIDCKY